MMVHGVFVYLLSVCGVLPAALTAVIQTQQTVLAAVGEDAEFSCQLLETKDVLQVTWQKISPAVQENVAIYNKYFGQRVNAAYKDKFKFKYTGLQNCSIVIKNVTEQDKACYLCLFHTYPEGSLTGRTCLQVYALTAVIQTQQTVLAAVGEDAEFSCQLLETKDVLQVTWQKISADVEVNVATYNKYFGQRVNDRFKDKFKFKYTGLQNCSIVIRNVMEQDEGCYHCLFNTYPEGSFIGRTCLQVYELHKPLLDVRESNSPAEWVVSCSATGRPAPTVTLSVSQQHLNFSQYNTVSVSNTNATFTVTTTAVLSGSRRNSTQVGCAARVLSAPQIEVIQVIPEVKQTSDDRDADLTWIIVFGG
ncbi:OX-2 membrane glycoprotein-like, partial [Archocentrus centrarchus]|uniref:OX-2 membrane glycoprotein-like n=1 Tax=Archocentrus centrarchus TaxID=63155 RepID=UPI0011E9DCE9